jgi:hypothetical protein
VIANVRERLAVSEQAAQRFNLRKVSELEIRKQHQIRISNWFAALENLSRDINRALENTEENIKTSATYGLKQHQ